MNMSRTIIISGVYLIIILLILNNISPESYLAFKYFIIRVINLDSALLTEILSKFARFMLSFYSSYNDKKYDRLELGDKQYYKYPPYLKDLPNCKGKNDLDDTNKNLIDIFSKENNYILSPKNNKININQVQPYQERPYQEKPYQEQLNNQEQPNQEQPYQKQQYQKKP